ncbi:MAG: GntR family transcriptional regulator [Rheinheimera sp.]|uniref:GntR family transcriptional regulator n=1 Tax=unclassified Arsukibacterium TaxID=2635278 RepID=UPI000C43058E|nr:MULTISPECIES: GntR family transcriptional regulator [unclassified Arsukibacterium]MAA93676.1 GntR family transcriptional regulator [Rheinheimera sp.]MBM33060.1 GntR family transcriptional regulator [Rheinheimera sp.]HAW93065.1 GntR family transcriptional regulator [Candidatus Azambacteria bacterium]|tara:strand:+ start:406 stop:783 length:378 start_codon:yes stop_codon:yes gene_type:complete
MIAIDLSSSEPLFNQLIQQIKKAIEQNVLVPGDQLPSIRQLASELDINSKTVAKAYQLLERDKVIESKGYRGSFVHLHARENVQINIGEWLHTELAKDIARYRAIGATDSEIRIAFNHAISNDKR